MLSKANSTDYMGMIGGLRFDTSYVANPMQPIPVLFMDPTIVSWLLPLVRVPRVPLEPLVPVLGGLGVRGVLGVLEGLGVLRALGVPAVLGVLGVQLALE